MGYIDEVLQPEEEIVHRAVVHWIVYWNGFIVLIIGGLWWLADPGIGVWIVALGGLLLVIAFIKRVSTELVITSKRVIAKTGFIMRNSSEINRNKVEGVDVKQGINGRIFGFGTITIRGTGGGLAPMKEIDDPLAFRNKVTLE